MLFNEINNGINEASKVERLLTRTRNVYKAVRTDSVPITESIRKSICEYQKNYAEYKLHIAQAHRAFKESEGGDSHRSFKFLIKQAETGLKAVCGTLIKDIANYFQTTHISPHPPRAALYIVGDDGLVYRIVHAPQQAFNNEDNIMAWEDNSTFQDVVSKGGFPVLYNSIPYLINCSYDLRFPGLGEKGKRQYTPKWIDRSKILARLYAKNKYNISHCDWEACWDDKKVPSGFPFKSQLAVPITFAGHREGLENQSNLRERDLERVLKVRESGNVRSILGFIVIDHPLPYYFSDEDTLGYSNIDVNMLYIFSDLMSLPIVVYRMYSTEASITVESYLASNEGP